MGIKQIQPFHADKAIKYDETLRVCWELQALAVTRRPRQETGNIPQHIQVSHFIVCAGLGILVFLSLQIATHKMVFPS